MPRKMFAPKLFKEQEHTNNYTRQSNTSLWHKNSYTGDDLLLINKMIAEQQQKQVQQTQPADEKNYEIALALSNNDPSQVKGYDEFKRGGAKYKPFKWYNYKYYEMPARPAFTDGKTLIADDWVFPNTVTGQALQIQIMADKDYKPTEEQLLQLAVERGKAIHETNTDLGENPGGNFDYIFDGFRVAVNANIKFKFEDDITETEQTAFKNKFFHAIDTFWTKSGVGMDVTGDYPVSFIPINITATEVVSDEHKIADVERSRDVTYVIDDINLELDNTERTIAHEFGHVLGLYDEYPSTGLIL